MRACGRRRWRSRIGKRYELTGWIRTEQLNVRDLDRSPIATGASLSMASMPFDVHSESVGGTRDWTRVAPALHGHACAGSALLLVAGTAALSRARRGLRA